MNILTVGSAKSPHVLTRAIAFIKAGHSNKIISTEFNENAEIKIISPFCNWTKKSLLLQPFCFLKNILIFIKIMVQEKCDVYHIHYVGHYLAWLTSIFSIKPIISIVMGGDVLFEQHTYMPWYQKKLVKYTLKGSNLIIAKSPYIKERILELAGNEIDVITNIFGVENIYIENAKNQKKVKGSFIHTRPLNKFYNIHKIIDIIYYLNKLGYPATLIVVVFAADPHYLKKLKSQVHSLNLTKIVSFIPESKNKSLIQYYNQSEFVITLPISDGIPQSALEGMACSCVNILPRNIVYKDIFSENNSILVEGNAKEIAIFIFKKIKNENLNTLRLNAYEFILYHGNIKKNILEIIKKSNNLYKIKSYYKIINKISLIAFISIYYFGQFFFLGFRRKLKNVWHIFFNRI